MIQEKVPNKEAGVPGMVNVLEVAATRGYAIKYIKADMDAPEQVIALQNIETLGLKGEDIVVLRKDTYVFMDRFFIVVQYMEKS